jgi:hypothetical protein
MSILPKYTCPNIDRVIDSIKEASKIAYKGTLRHGRDTDEYEMFDNIRDVLYDLEDIMKELRSDNSTLRAIAREYVDKCKALEKKNLILELDIEQYKQTIKL